MTKNERILLEIRGDLKELMRKLYGMPPMDSGDIGEIKESCKSLKCDIDDVDHCIAIELRPKIVRLETIVRIVAALMGIAAATVGILKWSGVF